MKKTPVDVIILHVYQKSWLYDEYFLRYEVQQTEFFAVLGKKLKFSKNEKIKIKN